LRAVIESLEIKSEWITFLSDNGPHYQNAARFFEFAINRYVRLGFDISEDIDIGNAIKGIRGTLVARQEILTGMNGPGQQKMNMQDLSSLVQFLILGNEIILSQQT